MAVCGDNPWRMLNKACPVLFCLYPAKGFVTYRKNTLELSENGEYGMRMGMRRRQV